MKFEFSNFQPFDVPLIEDGISYTTVEHYYQAMKTLDISFRLFIAQSPTPSIAKRRGRSVKLRDDWELAKIDIMKTALKHKFSKGTSHYDKLKNYNHPIVEINYWHDNFWGKCMCHTCVTNNISYTNCLGKLLEEIRKDIT